MGPWRLAQVVRSSVVMTFLIAVVAMSSEMHLLIKLVLISGSEWVQGAGLVPSTSVPAPRYYCINPKRQWLRMSKVDGNWSGMHKVMVCVCGGGLVMGIGDNSSGQPVSSIYLGSRSCEESMVVHRQ